MTALRQKLPLAGSKPNFRFTPKADSTRKSRHVRKVLLAQPVDATQASNLSAGVSNAKVLRGRSFSWRATLFR
jgi:hypothetical protein